jgi:hypothetical protein
MKSSYCDDDTKILNPLTGNCVNRNGPIGKSIIAQKKSDEQISALKAKLNKQRKHIESLQSGRMSESEEELELESRKAVEMERLSMEASWKQYQKLEFEKVKASGERKLDLERRKMGALKRQEQKLAAARRKLELERRKIDALERQEQQLSMVGKSKMHNQESKLYGSKLDKIQMEMCKTKLRSDSELVNKVTVELYEKLFAGL